MTRLDPARLPVQVASVVEETVDLFKAQVPPGVSVTLRIDAPDAVVLGDPNLDLRGALIDNLTQRTRRRMGLS
ncbi:hypothetical protein [Paraburkholderia sp. Ac-20347]|uniref:hypothetical protein n=1 Tax=Paraburkholderia sp. Ac-20347 TaxID=2703892 RepID=UPI00197F235C|nr:hypothetical protein [Paraburkholderia sp. Ac-20347]MBN3812923.1 hypothetical protein [Paraburkholderia sp. Ac-20347]